MLNVKKWRLLMLLLALLLALAACGGDDDSEGDADTDDEPTTEQTESAEDADSEGDADTDDEPTTEQTESAEDAEGSSSTDGIELVVHRDAPLDPDGDFFNDNVAAVGATGNPQLLEFYTEWCPTCRSMKATVHDLEADYWGQIDFIYLNRELPENAAMVEQYGVRGQPVFVLVEPDGTVVEQWFGGTSVGDLTAAMDAYLASAGG